MHVKRFNSRRLTKSAEFGKSRLLTAGAGYKHLCRGVEIFLVIALKALPDCNGIPNFLCLSKRGKVWKKV